MKTLFYDEHVRLGAKMVDFSGFEMPISYTSIKKEHLAVRNKVGLFDVSHMGEFFVTGKDATNYLENLCTNNISKLSNYQITYSPICYDNGTCVDDILVYKFNDTKYLCVVNCSNIEKDFEWFSNNQQGDVEIENLSTDYSQIALQGKDSEDILLSVFPSFSFPKFFHFIEKEDFIISRTGYTGEDGFEIYSKNNEKMLKLFNILIKKDVMPIGLGARDTLRFEACLPLYGHEISDSITPIEAGLKFFVSLDKPNDFIGKNSLKQNYPAKRKLIALELQDKGIAREGSIVYSDDKKIGFVTSGNYCPSFNKTYALALVETDSSDLSNYYIEVRNKKLLAKKTNKPIYRKKYKKN